MQAPVRQLGAKFWRNFRGKLTIMCVSELKAAMLGGSCMACPGLIPLLCNLTVSVDAEDIVPAEVSGHIEQGQGVCARAAGCSLHASPTGPAAQCSSSLLPGGMAHTDTLTTATPHVSWTAV